MNDQTNNTNTFQPKNIDNNNKNQNKTSHKRNLSEENNRKDIKSKKINANEKEKSRNASRDYRKRKKEYIENLEKKVGNLENEVKKLMQINEEQSKNLEKERDHKRKYELGKKYQQDWGNDLMKLENLLTEKQDKESDQRIYNIVENMKNLFDNILNLYRDHYISQLDFSIFTHFALFSRDSYHFEAYGDDSNISIALINQQNTPQPNNQHNPNLIPINTPNLNESTNFNSINPNILNINNSNPHPNPINHNNMNNNMNNNNNITHNTINQNSNGNQTNDSSEINNSVNNYGEDYQSTSTFEENYQVDIKDENEEDTENIFISNKNITGLKEIDMSIWVKLIEGLNVSQQVFGRLKGILTKLRENVLKLKIQHTKINNDLSLFIKSHMGDKMKDVGKIVIVTSKLGNLQKNYTKYWFVWQSAFQEMHSLFTHKQLACVWIRKSKFVDNCNILNSIWMALNRQTFSNLQSLPTFIPSFPLPVHLGWQFTN
eukprot:TRINITY_DN2649_c0_g1_i1.p1 TRINITY_DN2649_c0_g1~~TRINITY_DN2649_c0_g1_i1.p1  ORF type:complete len:570 (-),score=188.25 TRINITY_DN2649_c0_g1_i1:273-1739(-)